METSSSIAIGTSYFVVCERNTATRKSSLYLNNGLELDPSQMEIVKADVPPKEKTPAELLEDKKKRDEAFGSFFTGMVEELSKENRNNGGDGNVTGIVV